MLITLSKLFMTRSFEEIVRRLVIIAIISDFVLFPISINYFNILLWLSAPILFISITIIMIFLIISLLGDDIFEGFMKYRFHRAYKGNEILLLDKYKKAILKSQKKYVLGISNVELYKIGYDYAVNDKRVYDIVNNISTFHKISIGDFQHSSILYISNNDDIVCEHRNYDIKIIFSDKKDYSKAKIKYSE